MNFHQQLAQQEQLAQQARLVKMMMGNGSVALMQRMMMGDGGPRSRDKWRSAMRKITAGMNDPTLYPGSVPAPIRMDPSVRRVNGSPGYGVSKAVPRRNLLDTTGIELGMPEPIQGPWRVGTGTGMAGTLTLFGAGNG